MALPESGAISLSQVNVELGNASNAVISMGDADVRALFGVASGAISMSNGYGKSSETRFVNTVARTAASIFELMGSPTTPGTYVFENQAIISAGTASYALRTGVFPVGSTLRIINKSTIQGEGGNGGNGAALGKSTAGGPGGAALYVDYACTIDNAAGYIWGGGGGGGGTDMYALNVKSIKETAWAAGGGGQGGSGGAAGTGTGPSVTTAATAGSASAGGVGGKGTKNTSIYAVGGAGGGAGVAGSTGSASSKYESRTLRVGGAAGAAIARNGNTVTITAGNDTTRIKGAVA